MRNHPSPTYKPENFFQELQIEFLIHELKDPVSVIETGIRSLLEKREKYGGLSLRQEKTLKRVLRNTRKTREMLYDLLEVGRSQSGCLLCSSFQPERVAYEVLLDTLEMTAENLSDQCRDCGDKNEALGVLAQYGVFLHIHPELNETEIFQDEIKFRQILGNLIKNALRFRNQKVEIVMQQSDMNLLTEVTDDGPGIDPAHREAVFQQYSQINREESLISERKGHGLGLAGARILARCLGGDIELTSKKGNGAMFRLILPIKFGD